MAIHMFILLLTFHSVIYLLLSLRGSFYILDISVLSGMCFVSILSQSVACFFIFLTVLLYFQIFENFLDNSLSLTSNLIPWFLDNIVTGISVNVPRALEKNVYPELLEGNVLNMLLESKCFIVLFRSSHLY